MRIEYLAIICFGVLAGTVLHATHASSDKPTSNVQRTPVLVELFTSEGCSSCPPVDKLVAELESRQPVANAQVVLLSFHVDYWNDLGWKDRFASHDYTLRQQQYSALFSENEVYTPELVVDGKESQAQALPQEIHNAAAAQKAVALTIAPKSGHDVAITAQADPKTHARVLVAITEDGLSTNVGGGENGGHVLSHSGVVRSFVSLGKLEKGTLTKDFTVALDPQWQVPKLTLVCFAQDEKTGRVLGVSAAPVAQVVK
jgi:hypothetical protein